MNNEFKVMLIDAVVSIALYFGAKYAGASMFEDIRFMIGILQPIVIAWLAANAFIRVQAMRLIESMDEMDVELLVDRLANR